MDWFKEILELVKLVPVVFRKQVILVNIRLLVALVERKSILQVDATLDYEVGAVLSDSTISNES